MVGIEKKTRAEQQLVLAQLNRARLYYCNPRTVSNQLHYEELTKAKNRVEELLLNDS